MKKMMVNSILALAGIYITVLVILFFTQERFIFFTRKINKSQELVLSEFSKFEINISHVGNNLHGWFIKKEVNSETPLIIYYGGNAEEVSQNLYDQEYFGEHSLLYMNYRGYGLSTGRPGQGALFSDAIYIFDQISKTHNIPPSNIILMGRSLGAAVATHVASKREVKGVILVTPFDSLVKIAKKHYPIFPVKMLLKHPFNSIQLAPKINIPMMAIIASRDRIIPNEMSLNLVDHWGGNSEYVVIKNAGHNSIHQYNEYWTAVGRFLSELTKENS
ncbi:uncharacterized protein METZ01_LOCUS135753 [marine metagenome]|uniref:Serine aminopeptidase S33 domain-containing protein n=1 Tax=marine metagenome TaxID=408172 RepID=A0A381Z118_9ZZZZ